MASILRINEAVTLEFFERPGLKYTTDRLFKNMNACINQKISEIRNIDCIKESEFAEIISYEKIYLRFKYRFLKMLLDEAVEMSLTQKAKYDVLSNVISLLSKEKLYNAIDGEMIIYSVIDVIKTIETTNPMQSVALGSIIATLKQKFFVIKPPYSYD